MAKITTRNSELLKSAKSKTSPKVYSLLSNLVNDDREDLAEIVLKIDYLLEYASTCIKLRDFNEAKESLNKAETRMNILREENVNIDYLDYLYEGIAKKLKF